MESGLLHFLLYQREYIVFRLSCSLSWHAHIMSSIFHATLGKYVACMDLQEKEPWMKDQAVSYTHLIHSQQEINMLLDESHQGGMLEEDEHERLHI